MKKILQFFSGEPKTNDIMECITPFFFVHLIESVLILLWASFTNDIAMKIILSIIGTIIAWQCGWGMSIKRFINREEQDLNNKKEGEIMINDQQLYIPNTVYRHFKNEGNLYLTKHTVRHIDNGELYIVYHSLYGEFKSYIRDFNSFLSEFPESYELKSINEKYRFEPIDLEVMSKSELEDNVGIKSIKALCDAIGIGLCDIDICKRVYSKTENITLSQGLSRKTEMNFYSLINYIPNMLDGTSVADPDNKESVDRLFIHMICRDYKGIEYEIIDITKYSEDDNSHYVICRELNSEFKFAVPLRYFRTENTITDSQKYMFMTALALGQSKVFFDF